MNIAASVYQMTGLAYNYILWELPVAIALQLELLFWQREGQTFYRTDKTRIMRELGDIA